MQAMPLANLGIHLHSYVQSSYFERYNSVYKHIAMK